MIEAFDHTADAGFRVESPDLGGLFAEAAVALFRLIAPDVEVMALPLREELTIPGARLDDLLFDWLRALLMLSQERGTVYGRFDVRVGDVGLVGVAWGAVFDPAAEGRGCEVKAITYHGLLVEGAAGGWRAEVVVDI